MPVPLVSQAFAIERLTLAAGVRTPIYPPRFSLGISIQNGTAADLRIYSHQDSPDDSIHYVSLAAGYERPLSVLEGSLTPRAVAFWLESAPGGLAVLIWQ